MTRYLRSRARSATHPGRRPRLRVEALEDRRLLSVTIDTVPVANPGNAGELSGTGAGGAGPDAVVGGVNYSYNIGKFEVTNAQYTEFLNAKAAIDPLGLYNTAMAGSQGGITRAGGSGSYTYATISGMGDKPVSSVSWYDAIRFANWLDNGQGNGDTETGAYTLLGGTPVPSNGNSITRNPGATWFLPSEDEWYKAAYYDPNVSSYFDYPTSSNTAPTLEPPPGGANSANAAALGGGPNDVGAYTLSHSSYGTFDQGGNVYEWNEVLIGANRGSRAGSWSDPAVDLKASFRLSLGATNESSSAGFRVANDPEPVTPQGSEFQVNTYTTNIQQFAAVAADAAGDFIVAWESRDQDGSGYGVYAQRYNAAGVAQGSEFLVNTYTTNWQRHPSVAMDADGDFVVAWTSSSQDGSSDGIYAQRYNAAGVVQGSEFRVNTYTTANQRETAVAMDADGDFVVAWESYQDGSSYGVYAQRYNAAGVAQGSEFRVNTYTTSNQGFPAAAMDADGDFVVAWLSAGQDDSSAGIYAQRYNAAGVVQGSEFRVNTYTTNSQLFAAVAMDADGDFVVAWHSDGQDGNNYGIYAQRYNAAGVAQGSEFQVNTYTTSSQEVPAVAMDSDGDFIVAWESSGQDGSFFGVYAQRYDAAGVARGSEFRVNSYTTSQQFNAAVAMDADGDFVVAWQSFGQDGGSHGVYAQRYINSALATVTAVRTQSGEVISQAETIDHAISSLTVQFSRNMSTTGDSGGANSVTNPNNYQLLQGSFDISSAITAVAYGYNPATAHFEATLTVSPPLSGGSYQLIVSDAIQSEHGQPLDGDNDGVPGGDAEEPFEVPPSSIAGRFIFYNQSGGGATRYDGNNLAINASDDAAIATDKTAYLWEDTGAATFANVSSYSRGINGIMIDIAGPHPNISADDFIFRVGNNNSPGTWATANAPSSVSVRAGAGVTGSDRVEIIWAPGTAPTKQWLEVITLANADTGLAQKAGHPAGHGDAFFFGNAVGNSGLGDTAILSTVNATDENGARLNPANLGNNIPVTNIYDYDRNAQVNANDQNVSRLNSTNVATALRYLNLTTAPAAPEADGGDEISPLVAGDSGVASALATQTLTRLDGGVPRWLTHRIEQIDLDTGSPARLFQYLHDQNSPRSRALLQKFDDVADCLGLNDALLDLLIADLGLE